MYLCTCVLVYLCTCVFVYLCTYLLVFLCTCVHVYLWYFVLAVVGFVVAIGPAIQVYTKKLMLVGVYRDKGRVSDKPESAKTGISETP